MKKYIKIILLSGVVCFFVGRPVFANSGSLEINWPSSPGGLSLSSESGIAELTAYFYEWGISLGIIVFFGILIFHGLTYLSSAGNPGKVKKSRKRIFSSFAGLILLLGSYIILNAINPELTRIRRVSPGEIGMGIHEFQTGGIPTENMCEFGFVTLQDRKTDEIKTHLMVPGMVEADEDAHPLKSISCVPQKDEGKFLEVRKNDEDQENMFWSLYERGGGDGREFIEEGERVEITVEEENGKRIEEYNEEALMNLYSKRYQKTGNINLVPEYESRVEVHETLRKLREKRVYNLFYAGNCKNVIQRPEFNRPRCLELDGSTLKEWTKIGHASLIEAFEAIGENLDDPVMQNCPGPDDLGGALGYERDYSGGGCSLSLYRGDPEKNIAFGIETKFCSEKISEPSADMDHFGGIVDRPVSCIQFRRREDPLNISLPHHKVTIDRFEEGAGGNIFFCRGREPNCGRGYHHYKCTALPNCVTKNFLVPEGFYTVTVLPAARLTFSDNVNCTFHEENGEKNLNICYTEISEDKTIKTIED